MNRLLVALLAALDAAIAVAVGLVVVAAPLTLLWVFGFPGAEDWAALWPTSVRLWQFGHFVPIEVTLTEEYLTATGIPDEAASFVLSLAPTALAAFTAIFAARSGGRAARAGRGRSASSPGRSSSPRSRPRSPSPRGSTWPPSTCFPPCCSRFSYTRCRRSAEHWWAPGVMATIR